MTKSNTAATADSVVIDVPPTTDRDNQGLALVIERLAVNPDIDVVKLEKIIELQERIMRHNAKAAFDGAFSEMQGEIPLITKDGEIKVNGELRSRFAKNEDIQEVLKPILKRYGFGLRFKNEITDKMCKVVGILSHRGGHSEQDEFITAPDTSGGKNTIQSIGSARSYGQRYTTIALLNIACKQPGLGGDDDGHGTTPQKPVPVPPSGYPDWLDDLNAAATDGPLAVTTAWDASKPEFKQWAQRYDAPTLLSIKTAARKAGAK